MCRRIFNRETSPNGEVPFFKIGSFGKKTDCFISKELYFDYKKRFSFPKKGDVLISAAGTIGRTVVYDGEDAYYQDSNIIWIDNDNTKVINEFLYYILQIVKYNTEGGTIQRLYNNILKSTKFKYTSITEQVKIISFLSLIDKRIQTQNKIIDNLKVSKSALAKKIFSQKLQFKNNSTEWRKKKIVDIFYSEKGKGLSKDKIVEKGENYCILYGELYTKYKEVIKEVLSRTNETVGLKSEVGDILIPSSTTTSGIDLANVTALNKDNVLLGGDITVLRSKKRINNVFYAYYLSIYKKRKIASLAQGTTIVHLYFSHLKDLEIDCPDISEQTKIASFLSSLDNKIEIETNLLKKLEEQKKFLLQNMFV